MTSSMTSSTQLYQFRAVGGDGGGGSAPGPTPQSRRPSRSATRRSAASSISMWPCRLSRGCPVGSPTVVPRAAPWVVPWWSRGLSHGLSRGGPAGVPWFRIRAHRHLIACRAGRISTHQHTLKCTHTCKHDNTMKPPNTSNPDGARTKSVHTQGGKTLRRDDNRNSMMHLPRTPPPQNPKLKCPHFVPGARPAA